MYSGFISARRSIPALGVHQRINAAARQAIAPFVAPGTFPTIRAINHFEGYNGPDGLKIKSPGQHEPSHLYNPHTDQGPIPEYIQTHYAQLVVALREQDKVRAAFEASWMAHYICDGLTPAHHFPLKEALAEQGADEIGPDKSFVRQKFGAKGATPVDTLQRGWRIWGGKGILTTHFNFEMGVASALLTRPVAAKLDEVKLVRARQLGAIKFFKQEAQVVASMRLYERFYEHGWTLRLAREVRTRLASQIAETIAAIWILAYLEAEEMNALQQNQERA